MANTLTFASQTLTDANIFGGISFLADLNTGEEFSIGNAASASVSFTTDVQLPLYTKDATNGTFTWTQDSTSRGRFYITEVKKVADRYTVTAYDAMILLEKSISALSISYPLTVSAATSAIATFIGCTVSGPINNGTLSVDALSSTMTIRQLLSYVAEASGCSVKIDGSDHLRFMYYTSSGITVTASQYISLEVADYTCAKIDNVTIMNSLGFTVGTAGSGTNKLFIQANPFLENATNTVATTILNQVKNFQYAPVTCEMFEENGLEVGTIATFGSTASLVMRLESSENGAVASSVGSDSRAEYNESLEVIINQAGSTATRYITELNNNGIMIHAEGDTANYTQIDSTGMQVYQNSTEAASFGANESRVGALGGGHTTIQASGMQIYGNDGTEELANIGYGPGNTESGQTTDAPYYTFGIRMMGSAIGNYSVAEGNLATASGYASHAEGSTTTASGGESHAEGFWTRATGSYSHAEGVNTQATGNSSHAEGAFSKATGDRSHAQGVGTLADSDNQTAIGKYNVSDSNDTYALIIGNGFDASSRANVMAVDWNGNIRIKGNLYVGCGTDSTNGVMYAVSREAIAASSSKAITVTTGKYYRVVTASVPAALKGEYIVAVSSTGGVSSAPVRSASDLTITTSTNTLTIANGNASYAVAVRIEEI